MLCLYRTSEWKRCDVEVLLLLVYLLFSLFVCACVCVFMSARRHTQVGVYVCCLYVDQLSVFVQQQCCGSVLSGRASVRAGAILGSAVMLLLLLLLLPFDAALLSAL